MDFLGSNLSRLAIEKVGLLIDPSHRQEEADLMRSRWYDYADMHPVTATYLFAHLYKEQNRVFHERYTDLRTADTRVAFTPPNIFVSRDATSMWLGRACADKLGVPYAWFLTQLTERYFLRTFRSFPRPNQLYGEEIEVDLAGAWKDALIRSVQYSREADMKASQYQGRAPEKVQLHQAFVAAQIRTRQRPHHRLLGRFIREDIFTAASAVQHGFDQEEVDQALSMASRLG